MKNALMSLGTWAAVACLTVLVWVASLLGALLFGWWDRDRRLGHRFEQCWARAILKTNPLWQLSIDHQARLDPARPYVFVANHQSYADVLVLRHVNQAFKYVAKSSLYRVPFVGGLLSLNRHIRLERGSVHGTQQAMEEARRWLDRSMSVAFFVEGSRSSNGGLAPFKRGAFKLAIETGTPIVPVVITGTREALPRGTWRLRHRVSGVLTVLPPIETAAYRVEEAHALKQRVHEVMARVFGAASSA